MEMKHISVLLITFEIIFPNKLVNLKMNNLFLEDGKIIRRKINNLSDLRKLSIFLSYFLKPEFFLILQGNLGVGKTTLVKMIASKMGITKRITSPTFNICNTYKIIRKNKIFYLNHFDFFRIKKEENLNDLFQDISIGNINIIE